MHTHVSLLSLLLVFLSFCLHRKREGRERERERVSDKERERESTYVPVRTIRFVRNLSQLPVIAAPKSRINVITHE